MISKIQKIENFETLKKESIDFFNLYSNGHSQIMCQTQHADQEDLTLGIGRIDELEEKNEEEYHHIPRALKNSQIEKLIIKYKGFRTRILKLNPRSCYSIHNDPTPRIQIPIVSNNQCWMIWPYDGNCVNLKEGFLYGVDTTKDHTFINGDKFLERLHIVICTKNLIS